MPIPPRNSLPKHQASHLLNTSRDIYFKPAHFCEQPLPSWNECKRQTKKVLLSHVFSLNILFLRTPHSVLSELSHITAPSRRKTTQKYLFSGRSTPSSKSAAQMLDQNCLQVQGMESKALVFSQWPRCCPGSRDHRHQSPSNFLEHCASESQNRGIILVGNNHKGHPVQP